MRVAIVGTRCLEGVALARAMVANAIRSHPDAIFCTGDADGIDAMVREESRLQDRLCVIFDVRPERLKQAGWDRRRRWRLLKSRNQDIVRWCTHLLRIYCPGSPTFGSGWTEQYARQQGRIILPTIAIRCPRHQDEEALMGAEGFEPSVR